MAANKINLASRDLAKLPTLAERSYYADEGPGAVRGLRLVIQPSGHRSFELYRKVAGVPKRIGLGVYDPSLPKSREIPTGTDPLSLLANSPALNAKMARTVAAALNVSLDQGIDKVELQKQQRAAAAAELTLQAGFELYEAEHILAHGKRNPEKVRADFNRAWGYVEPIKKRRGTVHRKSLGAPDWSRRKLSAFSRAEIAASLRAIGKNTGHRTANVALSMLSALFNWLIKAGHYSGANPCIGIAKFRAGEVQRRRFLGDNDPEELKRFFAALDALGDNWFTDFVRLSLATGARLENVLGMRWQDVNLETGTWTVAAEESKNTEELRLILSTQARQILEKRQKILARERQALVDENQPVPLRLSVWVFPSVRGDGHRDRPTKPWNALLEAAKIDDFRIHDLRHTAASWLASQGVSLPMIGRVLGHKSVQSTARYSHLLDDAVRSALEQAEQARTEAAKSASPKIRAIR